MHSIAQPASCSTYSSPNYNNQNLTYLNMHTCRRHALRVVRNRLIVSCYSTDDQASVDCSRQAAAALESSISTLRQQQQHAAATSMIPCVPGFMDALRRPVTPTSARPTHANLGVATIQRLTALSFALQVGPR